ncbi:unnamed protein product [Cylicocyclus nassatus]|uniref:Uncharacterized protein n=1 Tax=Cylicocyclus nassatus TaxID=53992 RepID=A0AA36DUD3_CYLNA|nr:unnamed protein product [Cylicocyclus nassatus]
MHVIICKSVYHRFRTTPDQQWFGYSMLKVENTRNDSFYFGIFFDAAVTIYCGISYIALMIYIRRFGGSTSTALKREIRCFFQFVLMFVTYAITWITFYGYPITGIQTPEAYVVTPVVLVFNSGVNPIIFLTLNKEVIAAARGLCKALLSITTSH